MSKMFNFNSIITILSASPFIFITVFTCIPITTSDICATFNCGQGTCKASDSSVYGFECACYTGWKNMQVGPFTWPSCVLPNCSLDFKCGSLAPTPSPSPSPLLPMPDLLSPCGIAWCGDGTCSSNGTGHTCNCFKGANNLLSMPDLPCFVPCYLGSDCLGIGFGEPPESPLQSPPSHLPLQPPPPVDYLLLQPPSSTSDNNTSQTSNCSKSIQGFSRIVLLVVVVAATLLFPISIKGII